MVPGVGEVPGTASTTDQGAALAAHADAAHHGFTQAQALFGPEVTDASVPVLPRNVARKSMGGGELQGLPGAPEGEAPALDNPSGAMLAVAPDNHERHSASQALVKRKCVA